VLPLLGKQAFPLFLVICRCSRIYTLTGIPCFHRRLKKTYLLGLLQVNVVLAYCAVSYARSLAPAGSARDQRRGSSVPAIAASQRCMHQSERPLFLQASSVERHAKMTPRYLKICVKLASDDETVCQKLFWPLFRQIVNCCIVSNNQQVLIPRMLDALYDVVNLRTC
jgi:hypothetical protein